MGELKLSVIKRKKIRKSFQRRENGVQELAEIYGVSNTTIYRIISNLLMTCLECDEKYYVGRNSRNAFRSTSAWSE